MSTSRVLFCSYGYPRPDGDSGSRRLFDLLTFLRDAGWDVAFRACIKPNDPTARGGLTRLGVHVDDGSDERWAARTAEAGFDLAVIAYWPLAEWLMPRIRRVSPHTRIVVDSVDLHWLRESRQVFHQGRGGDAEPRLLEPGFGSQVVGEWNVYAAADAVLSVSDKETRWLDEILADSVFARTVPDCEDFRGSPCGFAERRGVLMLGSYNYLPNIEAAECLCREILPCLDESVLAEHPLSIVGQGLNERVRAAAAGVKNVRLVGFVPSVEPYFQRSRISVIPLLFGAGTKRKLLQALMCGTPSVTTSLGAEGLDLCDGQHALIADRPDKFAAAMARLLRDEALWTSVAAAGRDHVVERHGRDTVRKRFLETMRLVLDRPPKPSLLPEVTSQHCMKRIMFFQFAEIMTKIRRAMRGVAPPDAKVLVCADGEDGYLQLDGRKTSHFPQSPEGTYVGNNVADSAGAIAQIERLRDKGAEFLLVPATSDWWLSYYPEFGAYLRTRHEEIAAEERVFQLFSLGKAANGNARRAGAVPVAGRLDGDAAEPAVRLIAFYLPQYHPIPENDAWWGEGFTEWTNVAKAEPLFEGHYQPHLPADLGFYDLRLPELRREQADLAREHGIHGFCYYHYWFQGKRLLERPFLETLQSGQPDLPFCLCWANEPWSRRWNGQNEDVLQPQTYSEADDRAHIAWLLPALGDRRAIRIEGRPVFLVYQAQQLPDPARTLGLWRDATARAGLSGLYLIAVETGWDAGWDATTAGFDAKVLFQPQFSMLLDSDARIDVPGKPNLRVFDYQKVWPILANPQPVGYRRYSTVFPCWDNTPRTGEDGVVLHSSTPAAYEQWLAATIERVRAEPPEHRIVFINAWNEWGEGCHLEPDTAFGSAYLQSTRRALCQGSAAATSQTTPAFTAGGDGGAQS
jgi:hypothetical protein